MGAAIAESRSELKFSEAPFYKLGYLGRQRLEEVGGADIENFGGVGDLGE